MTLSLYKRQITKGLVAEVIQGYHSDGVNSSRTQYLMLRLTRDYEDGHSEKITMRLSHFRRIVKFMESKDFVMARRLNFFERLVLNKSSLEKDLSLLIPEQYKRSHLKYIRDLKQDKDILNDNLRKKQQEVYQLEKDKKSLEVQVEILRKAAGDSEMARLKYIRDLEEKRTKVFSNRADN